jgi:hypothetical protein
MLPFTVSALISKNKELKVIRKIAFHDLSVLCDVLSSAIVQGYNNNDDCHAFIARDSDGVQKIFFVATEDNRSDIIKFRTPFI